MTSSSEGEFNTVAAAQDQLSARLVEAVLERKGDDIAALLRRGADPDAQMQDFGPLLIYAVRQGNEDLVQQLAAAGATIDKRDVAGETALIWAAHYGLYGIVEYLLEQGADPTLQNVAGQTACEKAKQTASEIDPDDRRRTVEDIEHSFQSLARAQLMLVDAEKTTVMKRAPEIFHKGLAEHLPVRTPFKLKPSR